MRFWLLVDLRGARSRRSIRRNSTEYVDVQKNVSCARHWRGLSWHTSLSRERCRSGGWLRACCDLRRSTRAAPHSSSDGLRRALEYGRRFDRVSIRQPSHRGQSLSAATCVPAAAIIPAANSTVAANVAAANHAPAGRRKRTRGSAVQSKIRKTAGGLSRL